MYTLPTVDYPQEKPDNTTRNTLLGAGVGTAIGAGVGAKRALAKADKKTYETNKYILKDLKERYNITELQKILKSNTARTFSPSKYQQALTQYANYAKELKDTKNQLKALTPSTASNIYKSIPISKKYVIPGLIGGAAAGGLGYLYNKLKKDSPAASAIDNYYYPNNQ